MNRSTPLRRSAGLRPVSEVRRQRAAEREQVRQTVIARDGGCVARGLLPGACGGRLDPHEPQRGANLLDPDQVLCVCRIHHGYLHEHPADSYELGLLAHFYDEQWSYERDWKPRRTA